MEVRLLRSEDSALLDRVAPDVFDHEIDPSWAGEFLNDPRHHLVVAIAGEAIVGMATGIHYVHPDKPPELFVIEVAVTPSLRQQGVAKRLLRTLFERGRDLGCREAWVGTEPDNAAARALYRAAGGQEPPETFVLYSFDLES